MAVITARGKVREGRIEFPNPLELPEGTEVEVSISPVEQPEAAPASTSEAGCETDFARLPFFGMWADREDMADSVAWVRRQREQWRKRLERRD